MSDFVGQHSCTFSISHHALLTLLQQPLVRSMINVISLKVRMQSSCDLFPEISISSSFSQRRSVSFFPFSFMALTWCLGKGQALMQSFVVVQNASPSPAVRYSFSPCTAILTKPYMEHESFAKMLPPVHQQRVCQDLLCGNSRGILKGEKGNLRV